MATIVMPTWKPMATRHPEKEWGWRGIVDPSIVIDPGVGVGGSTSNSNSNQ